MVGLALCEYPKPISVDTQSNHCILEEIEGVVAEVETCNGVSHSLLVPKIHNPNFGGRNPGTTSVSRKLDNEVRSCLRYIIPNNHYVVRRYRL